MDEHPADELFRRALIDADASAAVALRVVGLPLCEALTVVFHGRRDLGTIQTYVTHGGRGAGSAVAADELLRVPCDLDLAAAGRPRGGRAPLRRAGRGDARRARGRRHRARHLARAARGPRPGARRVDRRIGLEVRLPAHRLLPAALVARRQGDRRHRRLLPAPARRGQAADGDRLRAAGRRARSTRCPTTRSAAWRTSSSTPRSTRAASASSSAARSSPCAASSSCPARASRRPRRLRAARMRRRPAVLIAAGFGVFVFLGLSFLLARGLTGASDRARAGARRCSRPRRAATRTRCSRELPACRAEPACARVTRDAGRASCAAPARSRSSTTRRARGSRSRAGPGTARVAWRAGEGLPVVQCVRVRREGPLTGGGRGAAGALEADRARRRLLSGGPAVSDAGRGAPRGVRVDRPAERARVRVAELRPWSRRRVPAGSASGSGTPPVGRGLGVDGSRSLPPPPPPSSSSGRLPGGRRVRAEEHHEEDDAEHEGDDVERTEDDHQLFIGRHSRRLPIPGRRDTGGSLPSAAAHGRSHRHLHHARSDRPAPRRDPAPPAACAAPAGSPASSTAATPGRSCSPSTGASCATRWRVRARSSRSPSTAASPRPCWSRTSSAIPSAARRSTSTSCAST